MGGDFKKRLRDYAEGKLSEEKNAEIELELEKMEAYQAFLDQQLDKGHRNKESIPGSTDGNINKKESKIIRKAKWKARTHNALTALAIIFMVTVFCSIATTVYFTSGKPNKMAIYRDVVRSTIAITEPNVQFQSGGTRVNPFFTMDLDGELQKWIGSEHVITGNLNMRFLLSKASFPERTSLIDDNISWPFRHPTSANPLNRDWSKLDKLPEGTVAEACISFNDFYSTDETLKKFKGKNMRPLWFAVDTGFDDVNARPSFIGFPYQPLWHHDDMTVTNHKEEKIGLLNRTVSESAISPRIEDYGSAEIRNDNFVKTLELLQKYTEIADRIAFGGGLRIPERLEYLKNHGVKIYGIVVTGPSKEILKLREESWVAGIYLGEVRLWNWEER